MHHAPFHPSNGSNPIRTLVYIGTPDNDQFTGPQDPQRLAEHIYRSHGPSGLNKDYLFSLEQALDELSPESGDAHVTDLADRVRGIITAEATTSSLTASPQNVFVPSPLVATPSPPAVGGSGEFRQDGSVEEQEETEKGTRLN
jgi:glutathione-specific gamma-glutamylcyclotransferase